MVDLCLAHVGSRKAVMITCKHFRTQFAIERARYAAARGASLLMLMPPYHGVSLNADAPSMLDSLGRIADAAKISILVLNAPAQWRHVNNVVSGAPCPGDAAL
ncbi:dihydrodipicolinate synthase/N-acetylneuraminate lyase [Bradyrhizobium sp. GM7.3]